MRILSLLTALLALALTPLPAAAQADDLRPLVAALGKGGFEGTAKAVARLAETGSPQAAASLRALLDGDLQMRRADGGVFIARPDGRGVTLVDPLTGETAGKAARGEVEKVKINNKLRRDIEAALGTLMLLSPDPPQRLAAAQAVFESREAAALPALTRAVSTETDPRIRRALREARAAVLLAGEAPEAEQRAAVETLKARGDQDSLAVLTSFEPRAKGAVRDATRATIGAIRTRLAVWDVAQNVWYGLSLGSVLLLAAIGLAITFGVMGVINMAHGEMVMLGAYTTFVVQSLIRSWAPGLFDASLLIALPLAFLVAGAIGVAVEQSIIRWLYGRPLETLLATWGLSLILQQSVRSLFGPSNREVGNPSWMSGAFDLGLLHVTYNRLWIALFSLVVFGALIVVLRTTRFGLHMRAVTQNRAMAGAIGIRTPRVDALTFGLGSGIAGIAGVALSQIDNVSPNLGQSFIVDSFVIVVFGGVGNLWGTLVGALTLGIADKFLEPYAGAVLGKILVLVFIILFIQRRPRGLFALKGRAVEA